jgi:hypothetical protein
MGTGDVFFWSQRKKMCTGLHPVQSLHQGYMSIIFPSVHGCENGMGNTSQVSACMVKICVDILDIFQTILLSQVLQQLNAPWSITVSFFPQASVTTTALHCVYGISSSL